MLLGGIGGCAMLILGIDEAAADTRLHVNQVELDDAGDVAPVLLFKSVAGALLGGQLQINTRGESHLVQTGTVVAFTVFDVF